MYVIRCRHRNELLQPKPNTCVTVVNSHTILRNHRKYVYYLSTVCNDKYDVTFVREEIILTSRSKFETILHWWPGNLGGKIDPSNITRISYFYLI